MTASTNTVQQSPADSEAPKTRVPLDDNSNCLWCASDNPGGPDCCKGDHPDARSAVRETADIAGLPHLILGAPKGTPQPGLLIGRAAFAQRRRTRRTPRGVR